MFNANAEEANKDGIVSDATNLGAMAQQFYKKPLSMGGGGNTFTGWDQTYVGNTGLDSTANGMYTITDGDQEVSIQGDPHDNTGYDWFFTTTVTGSTINSVFTP